MLDKDGDGSISLQEMNAALDSSCGGREEPAVDMSMVPAAPPGLAGMPDTPATQPALSTPDEADEVRRWPYHLSMAR